MTLYGECITIFCAAHSLWSHLSLHTSGHSIFFQHFISPMKCVIARRRCCCCWCCVFFLVWVAWTKASSISYHTVFDTLFVIIIIATSIQCKTNRNCIQLEWFNYQKRQSKIIAVDFSPQTILPFIFVSLSSSASASSTHIECGLAGFAFICRNFSFSNSIKHYDYNNNRSFVRNAFFSSLLKILTICEREKK